MRVYLHTITDKNKMLYNIKMIILYFLYKNGSCRSMMPERIWTGSYERGNKSLGCIKGGGLKKGSTLRSGSVY